MLSAAWIAVHTQGSAVALLHRVARQYIVLASRLSTVSISIIDY